MKAVGDLAASEREKALKEAANAPKDSQDYKDAMARAELWDEGGANKILLHATVGGIMSDFGGSSFASGAVGAGVNEAIQGQLSKIKDPALHQWASAIIGGAAAKIAGGDAQTGGATAASGTKNNYLNHELQKKFADELAKCTTEEERKAVIQKYWEISQELNREADAGNADPNDIIESTTTIAELQKELAKADYDPRFTLDYNLSQIAAKTTGTIVLPSDIIDSVQISDTVKRSTVKLFDASVMLWAISETVSDNLQLSNQQLSL